MNIVLMLRRRSPEVVKVVLLEGVPLPVQEVPVGEGDLAIVVVVLGEEWVVREVVEEEDLVWGMAGVEEVGLVDVEVVVWLGPGVDIYSDGA